MTIPWHPIDKDHRIEFQVSFDDTCEKAPPPHSTMNHTRRWASGFGWVGGWVCSGPSPISAHSWAIVSLASWVSWVQKRIFQAGIWIQILEFYRRKSRLYTPPQNSRIAIDWIMESIHDEPMPYALCQFVVHSVWPPFKIRGLRGIIGGHEHNS